MLFHRLLYGPIVTVDREAFRLTFGFGNGARLILCSEAGLYESGHIMGVDGTITVF